ncbi:hypothetical protein GW17_00021347 [Ensete ventricosum]|nr:hypothetical protein GW17_00021347 [Ensete ventricosum]RZS14297.1 hypothetical protein BHM03_00045972 [Ensete ventricosum]
MLLKASSSLAFLSEASPPHSPAALLRGTHPSFPASFFPFRSTRGMTRRASVVAAAPPSDQAITGVVFQPVEEIKKELYVVPTAPGLSIARQKYDDDCEAAINEQIK